MDMPANASTSGGSATLGNSTASRDKAYLMHPMTNLQRHKEVGPMVVTGGRGVYVTDETGKEYIEAMAGLWCTSLGFNEERLIEAAMRQFRKLPYYHQFRHASHDVGVDLAEKLIGMAPAGLSKVFFTNSGSEANDTILKLVWYYNNAIGRPQKKKVISRIKAYHGTTVAAASLSGLPHMHRAFDLPLPGILHTDCPHHYRFAEAGESEEDFATRLAENLDRMIVAEGPDTVAAFIAEPVMGGGGVIVPPRTYFEKIQAVLRKHDVLFIADEVICGFGRTGNMWGCDTFALKPDFMTVAKALSSAYLPIAGVLLRDEIFEAIAGQSGEIGTLGHGYTYSGHPVSAAVALETLKIYEERDMLGHVRSVMARFQDGLRRFADHPLVGEVRGVGLVAAVELVQDKATKQAFDPKQGVGSWCMDRAAEHGLITRAVGDSMTFSPPLIISADEIDEMLARFGRALDDTAAMVSERRLARVA